MIETPDNWVTVYEVWERLPDGSTAGKLTTESGEVLCEWPGPCPFVEVPHD